LPLYPAPSTPPGSPAIGRPPSPLATFPGLGILARATHAWLEPQDRPGAATLAAYVVSGVSAALALGLPLALVPFDATVWTALSWILHRVNGPLWALPIVFGLASSKRLPRFLAWLSIGLVVVYYGWYWLPVTSSPSTVVKALYIASAGMVALPALLRHLLRRRHDAA